MVSDAELQQLKQDAIARGYTPQRADALAQDVSSGRYDIEKVYTRTLGASYQGVGAVDYSQSLSPQNQPVSLTPQQIAAAEALAPKQAGVALQPSGQELQAKASSQNVSDRATFLSQAQTPASAIDLTKAGLGGQSTNEELYKTAVYLPPRRKSVV